MIITKLIQPCPGDSNALWLGLIMLRSLLAGSDSNEQPTA